MRKFILALLAGAALSFALVSSGSASDLIPPAYKAPPGPAAIVAYNWSGFYIGGHAGGTWADTVVSDPTGAVFAPPGAGIDINGAGFLGGGQLGYNWQAGSWVLGVQGDGS